MEDNEKTTIDDLIMYNQEEMAKLTPDCEEYEARLKNIERLYALKGKNRPPRISRDMMLQVGGNVLIAIGIIAYERTHVMGSQAFKLLMRPNKT